MDWQFTLLLIIVGLIIIGFIYFDAKRRSKVRREKVERDLYEQRLEKHRDGTGYDPDGIGQVRVIGKNEKSEQDSVRAEPVAQSKTEAMSQPLSEEQVEQTQAKKPLNQQQEHKDPIIDEESVPVLDDALFEFTSEHFKREPAKESEQKAAVKNEPQLDNPQQTSLFEEPEEESAVVEAEPDLIFSLYVVASQDKPYHGPELVQTLVEQGMRHGDMDIFHRHAQANGRGAVQFSLANAFEPGIFDLDDIDNLSSKGLALFMTLPGPSKPMKAYELMVKTAQAITQQLGGRILDGSRSNFSRQIETHHKEQISEFERRQLLNKQ
ncbi:cell division protein ZipA [Kangiella koreensis]|uniref:Cell division protein ZipA n=1 Tax=Kangiella koreensis (strain DSM 16069 / JCM 12317 / KCTC 12182 / SW-125) TaxID=523791 RepID=C7RBE3_KANKD|nr:cell division protein ZipA [Kangiella koreensis]ACV26585.1 cell division protein ZipA [Kangiella koreensis DSM 16069]